MPFRDTATRLDDIIDAIAWIERLTRGKSEADYRCDRPLRDAVERNLERISEASRHLPLDLTKAHPAVPWRQVADLGNRLRHGYDAIDHGIIWAIVMDDLPILRAAVEAMAKSESDSGAA